MMPTYLVSMRVEPSHPCLPGHFPGHPLVPGVVLLEKVADALRDWRGQRVARIVEAKFIAPLFPGEIAEITMSETGTRVRFEIRRDDVLLARGQVEGSQIEEALA